MTLWLAWSSTFARGECNEPCCSQQLRSSIRALSQRDDVVRAEAAQAIIISSWSAIEATPANAQGQQRVFPAKFREDLRHSRPEFIAVLKERAHEPADPAVVASLLSLALIEDDGSALRQVIAREFRGHSALELMAIQTLLSTTVYTLPNTRAVMPMILDDVRRLSADARSTLDVEPCDAGAGGAGTQLAQIGLAHVLVETNRTLVEMPHMVEAIDRKYPMAVRVMAVEVLAELGDESSSVLPALKVALSDESQQFRFAVACAITRIDPKFMSEELATSLAPADRKRFLDWARDMQQQYLSEGTMVDSLTLQSLESPYSFYKRKALRELLRQPVVSPMVLARLRELLSGFDPATSELARQVLDRF